MFTGHLPEIIAVLLIALVVFGPKRLPEIGQSMGRGIRDFRKGMSQDEESESQASQWTQPPTAIEPPPTEPPVGEAADRRDPVDLTPKS